MTTLDFYNSIYKYKKKINPLAVTAFCYINTMKNGMPWTASLWIDKHNPANIMNGDEYAIYDNVNAGITACVEYFTAVVSANACSNMWDYAKSLSSLNTKHTFAVIVNVIIFIAEECLGKKWNEKIKTDIDNVKTLTDSEKLVVANAIFNANKIVIAVDPIYGKPFSGELSYSGNTDESEMSLSFAKKLVSAIKKDSAYVVEQIRTKKTAFSDNMSKDLNTRCGMVAETGANVYIIICCNSSDNPRDSGFEVMTYVNNDFSKSIVSAIKSEYDKINIAIKYNDKPSYYNKAITGYLSTNAGTDTIVIKLGYVTNKNDESKLADGETLTAIANVIKNALDVVYKKESNV